MQLIHIILLLGILTLLTAYANNRLSSPVLGAVNRWLRWIVFSMVIGLIITEMEWSVRPYWVLVSIAFLGWFLVETTYSWLAIKVLSQSEIPLFPKFIDNTGGSEWPVDRRFLRIKDWLREESFRKVQSVRAEVGAGMELRSTVYQDPENLLRLQILFVPNRAGNIGMCAGISTLTESGRRIVTDNLFLPFGGFYPENWHVMRTPWQRSLPKLLRRHRKRLEALNEPLQEWDDSPLDDLNRQQTLLEKVNTEMGFLYPYELREEYGKITWEGRYRVWKEIWLLNYLGISTRY